MTARRKRRMFGITAALGICSALFAVSIWPKIRQEELNDGLIRTVRTLDVAAAERLLAQGADANAEENLAPHSFGAIIARLVSRVQHRNRRVTEDHGDTALGILLRDDRVIRKDSHQKVDSLAASLINHGADINTVGNSGNAALHIAAQWGLHRTLDVLLAHGAAVNIWNDVQQTPLMGADAYSTARLIEHGANVNAADRNGMTALSWVDDIEVAKILIAHGADVNHNDDEGVSILGRVQNENARTHAKSDLIQFLKEHGAHGKAKKGMK